MLIKLLNGDFINPTIIERIERYTARVPDPTLPDTSTEVDNRWGIDKRPKVNRPAIQVIVGEKPIYTPHFETEAEREEEMARLERAVLPTPTLVFPNLAVRLDSVQVVFFTWERSSLSAFEPMLKVTIQLANAEPYIVFTTQDQRAQAESLAAAFGVQIPERPKSAGEMLREIAEKK